MILELSPRPIDSTQDASSLSTLRGVLVVFMVAVRAGHWAFHMGL